MCDTACNFLFFLRVLVFVQLNVFAREATPDVSKGPGEEGKGGSGGQRAKERETEDTSNERRIEKLGGKLIEASG